MSIAISPFQNILLLHYFLVTYAIVTYLKPWRSKARRKANGAGEARWMKSSSEEEKEKYSNTRICMTIITTLRKKRMAGWGKQGLLLERWTYLLTCSRDSSPSPTSSSTWRSEQANQNRKPWPDSSNRIAIDTQPKPPLRTQKRHLCHHPTPSHAYTNMNPW